MQEIIKVDVDSVLAEIMVPWLGMYNNYWGDHLRKEDIKAWDMTKFVKPICGHAIYGYLDHPEFYKKTPVVPGALAGVEKLRTRYRVLFVTSGVFQTKCEWLIQNKFTTGKPPFPKDVVITQDKTVVHGDLLVDDNPAAMQTARDILFDQPWNRDYSGPARRAKNWNDVVRLALDMLL